MSTLDELLVFVTNCLDRELAYRQAAVAEVYFKSANYIFFSDNKGYLRFVHFADKSKTPDYQYVQLPAETE